MYRNLELTTKQKLLNAWTCAWLHNIIPEPTNKNDTDEGKGLKIFG